MKLLLTSAGAGILLLGVILVCVPILVKLLGFSATGSSRRRNVSGKSPERTEMQVVTTIAALITIVLAIACSQLEIFV
ncbi:unnamed protein product [Calypogeia fissa]